MTVHAKEIVSVGLILLSAANAVVVPPSWDNILKNEIAAADEFASVGSYAVTVTIEVGTDYAAETSCGPKIYLDDRNNGVVSVQFGSMPTRGATYVKTVYINYVMNPSNLNVMIGAACNNGLHISQMYVNGYQYKLMDVNGSQSSFWVDGDYNPTTGHDQINYYCVYGVICGLCHNCNYAEKTSSPLRLSDVAASDVSASKGSYAVTIVIQVGTHSNAQTSCGPMIYLQDSNNGAISVQFGAMPTPGDMYSETAYVNWEMSPSNLRVMIGAQCNDALQISQLYVNGHPYNLKNDVNGSQSLYWVDGDDSPNTNYCINGVVCALSYGNMN